MKNGRNREKPKSSDGHSSDMKVAGIDFNPGPDAPGAAAPPLHHPAEAARRRQRVGEPMSAPPTLTVISLGGGVQLSVMALMTSGGASDRMPDCVVFADARWEPPGVYDRIEGLQDAAALRLYVVHNVRSLCEDVKAVRRQAERPPEGRGTDRGAPQHSGPRGAGHDAEPLPEPARQGDRGQPRMHGNAGQRQAHALRSHPPSDAEDPWGGRLRRPFQIGG